MSVNNIFEAQKQPSPGWIISFKFGTCIKHMLVYLHLKFGDVQAEFKGDINDYIAKMV